MKKIGLLSTLFLFSFSVMYAQIPTKGLMAYYPFNGNANDSSGNGNNGVINGATLTTDRFGNANSAYSFDGVNDYIIVADNNSLHADSALTVSAWVYVKGDETRHTVLVKRYDLYSSPYNSYGLCVSRVADSQFWQASNYNSDYTTLSNDRTVPVEQYKWLHLVQKYDGKKNSLYVNGKLESTNNDSGTLGYSSLPLYIGSGATIAGQYMNGYIDDIRIYNYALSENEISALYKEGDTTVTAIRQQNINDYNIKVYPNPATNYLIIENPDLTNQSYDLEIINSAGQSMFKGKLNKQVLKLDLSAFSKQTVYFLKVSDKQKNVQYTKKIVIQ